MSRTVPAPLGPLITHPVLSRTRRICRRCTLSSDSADSGLSMALDSGLLSDSVIDWRFASSLTKEPLETSDVERGFGNTPLSDRITARSTRFWSSRILPGQSYEENASRVDCGICSIRFPMRLENTSMKCRTNSRMSSRRSLRGGTWTGKTFRR